MEGEECVEEGGNEKEGEREEGVEGLLSEV
jgi:hypothetical protein